MVAFVTLLLLSCVLALAWPHAAAAAAGHEQQQVTEDGLPGRHDSASDALLQWVRDNGGQAHVAVRQVPGQGRGTFAAADLQPGDVLASIPVELTYGNKEVQKSGFEAAGPHLLLDMANPNSFWQPYFRSLPQLGEVFGKEYMPLSYLPIIQDNNTETAIRMLHDNIKYYCEQLQPSYQRLGSDFNVSHCAHGAALLSTRTFFYGGLAVLLPIVDLANHDNACLHSHRVEPCDTTKGDKQRSKGLPAPAIPPESLASGKVISADPNMHPAAAAGAHSRGASGICIVWRAETAVAKGGEVCNNYGLLLQDNALLQYGYLQEGPIALELSMLDRPEHSQKFEETFDKVKAPWGTALPPKFEGTDEEIQAELKRLSDRLQALKAADAEIAAIKAAPGDPGGRGLALMLTWRQQRLAAIEREVQRLEAEAEALEKDEL